MRGWAGHARLINSGWTWGTVLLLGAVLLFGPFVANEFRTRSLAPRIRDAVGRMQSELRPGSVPAEIRAVLKRHELPGMRINETETRWMVGWPGVALSSNPEELYLDLTNGILARAWIANLD